MSDNKMIKGSCLCGSVRYEFHQPVYVFQYCHCSRCQKFTGSAHATNILTPPDNFKWTQGEEFLGRYELPDTKHFATCFCKNCGSSLPWITQSNQTVVIPAGTLDDDPEIRPKHNIMYDSKSCWYESVDSLPKYSELPTKS